MQAGNLFVVTLPNEDFIIFQNCLGSSSFGEAELRFSFSDARGKAVSKLSKSQASQPGWDLELFGFVDFWNIR